MTSHKAGRDDLPKASPRVAIATPTKGEIFAAAFSEGAGQSLGRLTFWLPVLYFGRDLWRHLIDAISSHIH